ncbi:MAG TPA: hypothetical protein VGI89_08645 [Rhizomicrobium sp.]
MNDITFIAAPTRARPALVDGLIWLHGGAIQLANIPGGGLKASLYFPSTIPADQSRASA